MDRHGLGISTGGQSTELTDLIERARTWEATATPYQRVSMESARTIRIFATSWILAVRPWDPNRAMTVIEGRPRYTAKGHERGRAPARQKLEQLILALKAPDESDSEFMRDYHHIGTAIFALREPERLRLAEEFQTELDKYPIEAKK